MHNQTSTKCMTVFVRYVVTNKLRSDQALKQNISTIDQIPSAPPYLYQFDSRGCFYDLLGDPSGLLGIFEGLPSFLMTLCL